MDASRHISFRPIDHVLLPAPWHQGRVVLLGDAAHALTPQLTSGGGMAIEDAVVLCEELHAHEDVEAALDAYGTRRAERVRPIYEHSLAICKAEQDPAIPDEQTVGIMMNGYALLAQPFWTARGAAAGGPHAAAQLGGPIQLRGGLEDALALVLEHLHLVVADRRSSGLSPHCTAAGPPPAVP